jgi:hypothetical protein
VGHKEFIDMAVDLECLELGIIPVSDRSFLQFKGMPEDDIRIAKRKYRKLKRKLKKRLGRFPSRWDVIHHLRSAAWAKLFNA